MGERALESPDLGLCFKYPYHGCWMPRKFFTGPQRSGSHFFLSLVHSVEENLEISWSQKSEFWWSKWLEKICCKCFWGVWNMKGWCLGCIQRVSSFRTPIEGIFLLLCRFSITVCWKWLFQAVKVLPNLCKSKYHMPFCLCVSHGHKTTCVGKPWPRAMF